MGAQLFPGGLATTTPQHFVVASGPANPGPDRSHADRQAVDVCTADRPRSVRFEPAFHFRGFHHWFLHTYTSPSRLTGPGRLTVPTRPAVVGAAPTLTRTSGLGLPPALSGCCDSPTGKDSHLPTVPWRLVAHGVVRPDLGPALAGEAGEREQLLTGFGQVFTSLG
jgi:hypothetical protein